MQALAPCGMNCQLCYQHLKKKPCLGCRAHSENMPASCRACEIRSCADRQDIYCFQCEEFPCKRIKALDKSYRTRYGVSLTEWGKMAEKQGVEAFLQEQLAQYTCECGGLISIHDGDCSKCGKQYPLGRAKNPGTQRKGGHKNEVD